MWEIKRTETFLKALRKFKNNHELLHELEQKIPRLQDNPLAVGGELGGILHGLRSTRLAKKFRLIFSVNISEKAVYLEALDHRETVYD